MVMNAEQCNNNVAIYSVVVYHKNDELVVQGSDCTSTMSVAKPENEFCKRPNPKTTQC